MCLRRVLRPTNSLDWPEENRWQSLPRSSRTSNVDLCRFSSLQSPARLQLGNDENIYFPRRQRVSSTPSPSLLHRRISLVSDLWIVRLDIHLIRSSRNFNNVWKRSKPSIDTATSFARFNSTTWSNHPTTCFKWFEAQFESPTNKATHRYPRVSKASWRQEPRSNERR